MAGTIAGGMKAAKTNLKKHGKDFYRIIGSKGGQVVTSKPKGFAANPEIARLAGARGGKKSRRTGKTTGDREEKEYVWKGGPNEALVFKEA